jgi:uncharacterized protein
MYFLELAEKIIREENKPLTYMEIWNMAEEKNYTNLLSTKGKTPNQTMGAQLYMNVKKEDSRFIVASTRPTRFFLKSLGIVKSPDILVLPPIKEKFTERDLHPVLTYYAYSFMSLHLKTIHHEKTSYKTFSQWLHPDLVGVRFFYKDWQSEVIELDELLGNQSIQFYSFELKKEISYSNIREAFFQTVSNSTWANEGYLVSPEIYQEPEFLKELERLSTSFGIGIIELDLESPDSSRILYPARHKDQLDWNTMNTLADKNRDFKEFLVQVRKDLAIKEARYEKYDKVEDVEDLIKRFKK